jgi:hypothetical protein
MLYNTHRMVRKMRSMAGGGWSGRPPESCASRFGVRASQCRIGKLLSSPRRKTSSQNPSHSLRTRQKLPVRSHSTFQAFNIRHWKGSFNQAQSSPIVPNRAKSCYFMSQTTFPLHTPAEYRSVAASGRKPQINLRRTLHPSAPASQRIKPIQAYSSLFKV